MSTDSRSVPVSKVIEDELRDIDQRRGKTAGIKVGDEEITTPEVAGNVSSPDDEDWRLTQVRLKALEKHVVGLSFSGGGIRSGTFAVGFLQGLAQVGLLRRIDYLSTVSGGGYAGAWLAAWLKRDGDPRNVEHQLSPNRVVQAKADRTMLPPASNDTRSRVVDDEPTPLHHLRQYSSYLTPRPGLLTADTWTVIAIWLRNVSVNLVMMLLPMTILLVLVARTVIYLYGNASVSAINGDVPWIWICRVLFVAGFAFLGVAFYRNAKAIGEFREVESVGQYRTGNPRKRPRAGVFLRRELLPRIIVGLVCLTVPLRGVIWNLGDLFEGDTGGARISSSTVVNTVFDYINANLGLLDPPNLILHALVLGLVMAVIATFVSWQNGIPWRGSTQNPSGVWKYASSSLIAGASAGTLIPLLETLTRHLNDVNKPELAATIIPPMALLIVVTGLFVEVALLGRSITEAEREWWSRLCAFLLIASLLWLATLVSIVYVPALFLASGPWLRSALASGWLLTTAFGVLSGKRAAPSAGGGDPIARIASFVPPIFLVGFLGAASLFASTLINMPPLAFLDANQDWTAVDRYFLGLKGASIWSMVGWMVFFSVLYWFGNKRLDVNLFSLHAMYANRLIRCYLGASRPKSSWAERWGDIHDQAADSGASSLSGSGALSQADRDDLKKLNKEALGIVPDTPASAKALTRNVRRRREKSIELVNQATGLPPRDANPETGFDPSDDIPLFDLGIGRGSGDRTYWGPQLLVNTTLNLVAGEDLAWQDRKGESFVLTSGYCGSKGVGYAKVTNETRENLTLGRAITISGAAVDPNMSFYQSSALTAFLTIFNARLGQWMQNPRFPGWKADGPKFGDRLVAELSGTTDDKNAYVHLSDGGHFENLGVYELIRRRCRYIIVVDAGEDTDASDDNLATLTRLCRIDFGVRIEVDTDPLEPVKPSGFSRTHVVVGRVHYEDVDSGQVPGIIIYVKISLTGDEPSDVLKYAKRDPRFPHQPTDLRQSFTDEQFESYRALGDHIARDVFADSVRRVRAEPTWTDPKDFGDYIRGNQRLFSSLRSRWATSPADHDARHIQSSGEWIRFQRDIRREPALAMLSHDLYPELPPASEEDLADIPASSRRRAELHAVSQMIEIMENAWINLRLKGRDDLPMDHGWMNVFRRWSGTKAFHQLWPLMRSEFSPDFVKFCETQLHLGIAAVPCHKLMDDETDLGDIFDEFRREWPAQSQSETRDLKAMVGRARGLDLSIGGPPAWVLYQAPAGLESAVDASTRFPCGVILLAEATPDERASRDLAAPSHPVDHAFELFAWVRRPHRSTGLGSRAFLPILDVMKDGVKSNHAGKKIALMTRFPKWDDEGDQELAMWANFFALYDFKPLRKTGPDGNGTRWTILEHRFNS